MKKRLLCILLLSALIFSIGITAFAAAEGFTMKYLPGTSDTVTNMPADDKGIGGTAYSVSADVPQREGYEFLGWTLDYDTYNTYSLTYQVEGDPAYGKPADAITPDKVTGIRESSNITLADAPDTAWVTKDGSPAPTTDTYMVNYLETGTDKVLAPQKVVPDQEIGSTLTEEAINIDGYLINDEKYQDITIKQSKTGQWTFTGWCSDKACTKHISDISNISADTTVYGKWEYEEADSARNEITFYYVLETSYEVFYIDRTTGRAIAEPKTMGKQKFGDTVTEKALPIENYDLDDESVKSIKLKADNNRIIFYYKPVVQYTSYDVRYVDRTTDADIAAPKTVDNQKVGDTVTENAVTSDNYDLDDDSVKTLTLQSGENEIIFYYKPAVANYTVRYVDVSSGDYEDIIAPENGTGNVGSSISRSMLTFEGYSYLGFYRTIRKTLSRDYYDNVIVFEYLRQV